MPPLYFSLRTVQPFADMANEDVEGEPGVSVVRADGVIVGLYLGDPKLVLRLDAICERIGIDPERAWVKLRADTDVLGNRRQAVWGGSGP